MAPSLAEWLDLRFAARHDVRVVEHGAEFPAERIEGLMFLFAQIYAWFMHHHSAQFGLIWTTITATAAMGMTLSIREETAPTSPKGTTPQLNLVPRRHIGALVTRHTNGTHRGEGREPRAAVGFGSFRLNFPTGAIVGLLALFLASYIAIILVWEDFASADDDWFTLGTLQGRNISLPIWPSEGRFFPFGLQEFNLIRHFTSSITGYQIFPIIEFLFFCWMILLILGDEPISFGARASLLIFVALSPAILISFSELFLTERNLLLFLACFVVSVKRFEWTLATTWAIAAVVCAQIILYLKEPACVLLFVFAASRLSLRCGMVAGWRFDQLWVRESRLDLGLICLSVLFLILYFGFVGFGPMDYNLKHRVPFVDVLLGYTRWGFGPWLLVAAQVGRIYLMLRHRSAPCLLWDGLAFGAVAYLLTYVYLGMFSGYYLAPVDLITILYIGRIAVLSWSKIGRGSKIAIAALGSIIFLQDTLGSTFFVFVRKDIIQAKAEIASAVQEQFEHRIQNDVRLFFPFAYGLEIMRFGAYLNYRGVPVDGATDDAPPFLDKVRLAKSTNGPSDERTDQDGRCVDYRRIRCELVSGPAPGDLVIVLPTDVASRLEVSMYREKGELLLYSKPLFPIPNSLHSLFEYKYMTGQIPDRWMDASVTKWTRSSEDP